MPDFHQTPPSLSDAATIYLDESGDLGWTFDKPYRRGGSSRYLTLAALCIPAQKRHLPRRAVRNIYTNFGWETSREMKWARMNPPSRSHFTSEICKLCDAHPDISIHAIVVNKQNVEPHVRSDGNKLYNYMIKLALLQKMARHERVTLVPDPRSIKVKSGNSLHDYLQTELWFTANSRTILQTLPADSAVSSGVQFVDALAGIIQSHFEDQVSDNFLHISPRLTLNRLYF